MASTLEDNLIASYKIKHIFLHDPVTMLLGTYTKQLNVYVHKETCTWFIEYL